MSTQASVARDRSAHINITIESTSYHPVEILAEKLNHLKELGIVDEVRINSLSPIEKMLLAEPNTLPNPYTATLVRDRRVFKGRDTEIRKIVTCLSGSQNTIVLYGVNRVGKTSLLHYVHDQVAQQYGFVPVLVDMQGLGKQTESYFWKEMLQKINETLARHSQNGKSDLKLKYQNESGSFETFSRFLHEAKDIVRGQKILIMIDELSVLDELWSEEEATGVIYQLKSLVENNHDVAFILCVQESIYKAAYFMMSKTKMVTLPVVRTGFPIKLGYLDRQAAEKLIREPMGQMLRYDDRVVEKILKLTACHPYYLQNLLLLIVDRVRMSKSNNVTLEISSNDVDSVIPDLLDNGEHLFFNFLQEYRGFKRAVLSGLAYLSEAGHNEVTTTELLSLLEQRGFDTQLPELTQTLMYLCDVSIVECREDLGVAIYQIRVPLFSQWLSKNRPISLITSSYSRGDHESD